ncbi:MAG TPA: nitroreductase family deazaflavin-dependent oxidoreductase [Myxococcota bacterium]|nr:nitroreductase family deazaflavin-dependent oxidoreductase [Myxococcota bacterium]
MQHAEDESRSLVPRREPFAARLHGFALAIQRPQRALVHWLRRDLERAPHWVLLVTRGRKTGLPREVLLPCARDGARVLVISTYARRAAWLRNVEACGDVRITSGGATVDARAEVVDDLACKHGLVEALPFIPLAPWRFVQKLARGAAKPLAVAWLRRWVAARPVVLITIRSNAAAP